MSRSWLHDWVHAPNTHAAMDVLIDAAVRGDVHTTNHHEVHTGGFGDGTPDMWAPEPEPWECEPAYFDDIPDVDWHDIPPASEEASHG